MSDSMYKILHLVGLVVIAFLLFRIGTELDRIANQIWQLNNM
jgi:hypothetical protein